MNEEITKIFFPKEVELVKDGKCPGCKQPININEFRDVKSKKDYLITGMCQKCQDEIYGVEEE